VARTWNYRLIESEPVPGRVVYSIHEVCYDDGKLNYYASDPVIISTIKSDMDVKETLITQLDRIRKALDKPTLKHADFYLDQGLQ